MLENGYANELAAASARVVFHRDTDGSRQSLRESVAIGRIQASV